MRERRVWEIFLVVQILFLRCVAYRHGDSITMLQRTQYEEKRSEWEEMPTKHLPRFGMDRKIEITPLADLTHVSGPIKFSFSFAHDDYMTSWITVTDGQANFLRALEVEFVHSQDDIHKVVTTPIYDDRKDVHEIEITYLWTEEITENSQLAFEVLLVTGMVTAWGSLLTVVCGLDTHRGKPTED